ncbi:MAG: hypothetical protein A2138_16000 [Deltaproteobacteria bacterium RBG_16_71_12]|nr:MAG: hypothetical protein A2138_16000 [Deltaproteobacteria bacterium RBG_16_71_12]
MSKVTSKLQVTVPKALAEALGIEPGDEIDWVPAEGSLRIVPTKARARTDPRARLRLFDKATERLRALAPVSAAETEDRGWRREDLYDRARPR